MIRELYGECQILYSIENFVKDQSLKLIVNGKIMTCLMENMIY